VPITSATWWKSTIPPPSSVDRLGGVIVVTGRLRPECVAPLGQVVRSSAVPQASHLYRCDFFR
jgi:hypothetical protein